MKFAADPRKFLFERGALLARQCASVTEQSVPWSRAVVLFIDLPFDLGNPVAKLLARDRIDGDQSVYHLKMAAATNAMIIRMPNSMCNCTERIRARFSL